MKKNNASKCDGYRMISFRSHLLKTLLRIMHTPVYKNANFKPTSNPLFECDNSKMQRYEYFIDYQKAFDYINHYAMIRHTEVNRN